MEGGVLQYVLGLLWMSPAQGRHGGGWVHCFMLGELLPLSRREDMACHSTLLSVSVG